MTFKSYIELCEIAMASPLGIVIPNAPFGAISANVTGNAMSDIPNKQQTFNFDLSLPTVNKTAIVTYLNKQINPITIALADGTKLMMPYDAFNRIKGEPRVGNMMTVVLQRRPSDKSSVPSQVKSIQC